MRTYTEQMIVEALGKAGKPLVWSDLYSEFEEMTDYNKGACANFNRLTNSLIDKNILTYKGNKIFFSLASAAKYRKGIL